MSFKAKLARPAHAIERRVDRVLSRFDSPRVEAPVIKPYIGYASPDGLVVRGRVLSKVVSGTSTAGQSIWRNAWQMIRLFLTDEVADVLVTAPAFGVSGRTDEEGYFNLTLAGTFAPGWHDVVVDVEGTTAIVPVHVPDPDADFLVISDVDDTMMQTGAYSLWRTMWTTLSGNAETRHIFPDAVDLMDMLTEDGRNPVFYVSSSPWNLYGFLGQVFDRHRLVRGPMFLRDLGISDDKFLTRSHGNHKGDAIDTILAANPDLPAVLIGDTGQHDAWVYLAAAKRHPGRVVSIILRAPGRGVDAKDEAVLADIRAADIPVYVGADYDALVEQLEAPFLGSAEIVQLHPKRA